MSSINKKTRIGVLCGGLSSERDVSLRSGKNCLAALQRLGYQNSVMIDVGRDVAEKLKQEKIEIAFLALHGKYGEDGCIQGLLEIMGIPYTGNRVLASAMTMDKDVTKKILKDAGLPVLPWTTIRMSSGTQQKLASVTYQGTYPAMVKPLGEGSSVGMAKVDTAGELDAAVQNAANYGGAVMIEPFIPGKDITVGVFDVDGEPRVTPLLELRSKKGWYDLESKYTEGLTQFILPAELPEAVTKQIQETTLAAHQAMGCHGVSRTDFVVDGENRFYILEVNTIPGMTDLSDLPAQAKAIGTSYDELVEYILGTAVAGQPCHVG